MSNCLIQTNNPVLVRAANLQRLSTRNPKNIGGQVVSARTQRRAAASDLKRALKRQRKKEETA